MHVINVLTRNEGMQRRVDRGCARVQVERAVRVHADHIVFNVCFWALDRRSVVERNELK